MTVDIDTNSGFCFGVQRAIATLENRLDQGDTLYCVGDIVHNGQEIDRLQAKGLRVINTSQLQKLHSANVLFRAHGEPPSSYQTVTQNGLNLIDATCPVVLKLQQKIREADMRMRAINGQVVLFGKKGHAEVIGLMGQIQGIGILLDNPTQIHLINPDQPVELFAQTTKNPADYNHIAQIIRSQVNAPVTIHQTICRQMASRAEKMDTFARKHQIVIFVGGAKSSNSKVLFDICKNINPRTHFVTSANDLQPQWLQDAQGPIGIMGATSTPLWLMQQIKTRILNL